MLHFSVVLLLLLLNSFEWLGIWNARWEGGKGRIVMDGAAFLYDGVYVCDGIPIGHAMMFQASRC